MYLPIQITLFKPKGGRLLRVFLLSYSVVIKMFAEKTPNWGHSNGLHLKSLMYYVLKFYHTVTVSGKLRHQMSFYICSGSM